MSDITITSNTIAPLEVVKPWHVGGSELEWVGLREWMACAWFKKKITLENWKNKNISVYILGTLLGPLVE